MKLTFRSGPDLKRGFTLIELMVVVIIIGIMSALIIPEMRGTYDDARLRASSRKLLDVFTLAYSRAVTYNQLCLFHLDRKTGRFRIDSPARRQSPGDDASPEKEIPGGEGEIDLGITVEIRKSGEQGSEPSGQEAPPNSAQEGPGSDDAISFNSDGTADEAEVVLRDRHGFRLALRINPTTARVHIVELERE
jgi:type II secretion system protein H